jgi:hypothetical protein
MCIMPQFTTITTRIRVDAMIISYLRARYNPVHIPKRSSTLHSRAGNMFGNPNATKIPRGTYVGAYGKKLRIQYASQRFT